MSRTAAIPRFKGVGILTPALGFKRCKMRVCGLSAWKGATYGRSRAVRERGGRMRPDTERDSEMWALCNGSVSIDPEFRC